VKKVLDDPLDRATTYLVLANTPGERSSMKKATSEKRAMMVEALVLAEIGPPRPTYVVSVEEYGYAEKWHSWQIRPFLAALAEVSGEPLHAIVTCARIEVYEGDDYDGTHRDITPPEVEAWGWSALDESIAAEESRASS